MSFFTPARKRTYSLFLFLFLVQLGALFVFSERTIPTPITRPVATRITLTTDPSSEMPWPVSLLERHPMFYVLPNEHSFSFEAWMNFETPVYEAPVYRAQPSYLEMSRTDFAANRNSPKLPDLNLFATPSFVQPPIFLPPPSDLRTNSSFRLEGFERPLIRSEPVPSITHPDAIANTTVEIGVDNSGAVVSARIPGPGRSGLAAADALAIRLAHQMVFAPSENQLEWARVVFHWHTTLETAQK